MWFCLLRFLLNDSTVRIALQAELPYYTSTVDPNMYVANSAILSRYPLTNVERHDRQRGTWLEATAVIDGIETRFITSHYPIKDSRW